MDLLLPFYAIGRLGPEETARVEAALAARPDMQRRLMLVREEQTETVRLNEGLGAPSRKVRDDLFARIDALESRRSPLKSALATGWLQRIVEAVGSLSPRTLTLAAGFAALVILLQGGALVTTLLSPLAQYRTASQPGAAATEGAFLLVAFAPDATVAQMAAVLQARGAVIVDGPHSGGLYRVRVAEKPLPPADLNHVVSAFAAEREVVRIIFPAPAR
jgi:anti-sigma factor RsiW